MLILSRVEIRPESHPYLQANYDLDNDTHSAKTSVKTINTGQV